MNGSLTTVMSQVVATVGRLQVGHAPRDLGRGGWISNESHTNVSMFARYPAGFRSNPKLTATGLEMLSCQIVDWGQLLTRTRTLLVG